MSAEASQKILLIPAAEPEAGALFEDNDVVPMRPGLQFLYAVNINDLGAMDTSKLLRVQTCFDWSYKEFCKMKNRRGMVILKGQIRKKIVAIVQLSPYKGSSLFALVNGRN